MKTRIYIRFGALLLICCLLLIAWYAKPHYKEAQTKSKDSQASSKGESNLPSVKKSTPDDLSQSQPTSSEQPASQHNETLFDVLIDRLAILPIQLRGHIRGSKVTAISDQDFNELGRLTIRIEKQGQFVGNGFLLRFYARFGQIYYYLITAYHVLVPDGNFQDNDLARYLVAFPHGQAGAIVDRYALTTSGHSATAITVEEKMFDKDLDIACLAFRNLPKFRDPKYNEQLQEQLDTLNIYMGAFTTNPPVAVTVIQWYYAGRKLFHSVGKIIGVPGPYFEHSASTERGTSGAPIFIKQDHTYYWAGIHTGFSSPWNRGVPVYSILSALYQWQAGKRPSQKDKYLQQAVDTLKHRNIDIKIDGDIEYSLTLIKVEPCQETDNAKR